MRYFLSIVILFFVSAISAQTRVDTVLCGDIIGVGKIVNGKKEGLWHYRDKNYDTPTFTGNYHEDKKTGEWIITCLGVWGFAEKRIVHYENNLLNGPVEIYLRNDLYAKGSYLNGLKNGEWDYYYHNIGEDILSNFPAVTANMISYYQNGTPTGRWKITYGYGSWSGEMNAFGRNGYWLHHDTIYDEDPNNPGIYYGKHIICDSGKYVNGKKEGFWKNYGDEHTVIEEGNYLHGNREGHWTIYDWRTKEIVEYKNGLREGSDSIWENDTLSEVVFYLHDKINGPQFLFVKGKLSVKGLCIPNPADTFQAGPPLISVPIDLHIDMIENCCNRFLYTTDEFEYGFQPMLDSLIQSIKKAKYRTDAELYNLSAPFYKTVRTGHWIFYYPDGTKNAEGNYLPIVRDSLVCDSTNLVEDPNNPGTFFLAPIACNFPVYVKTGWWKIYNEQGVMIREDRYDEKGILVETKKVGNKK